MVSSSVRIARIWLTRTRSISCAARFDGGAGDSHVGAVHDLLAVLVEDSHRDPVRDLLGDDVRDVGHPAAEEIPADAGEVGLAQPHVDRDDAQQPQRSQRRDRNQAEQVVPVEDRERSTNARRCGGEREVQSDDELDPEQDQKRQVDLPEVVDQMAVRGRSRGSS